MVVGLTNRQWDGLRAATGLQVEFDQLALRLGVSLAREGARFKARNEITALLKPWFRAHRVEDFARSFDEHGVTWSVFRSFKPVVEEDPDCSTQNPMFSMLEQPGIGSYLAPGLPDGVRRAPPRAAAPVTLAEARALAQAKQPKQPGRKLAAPAASPAAVGAEREKLEQEHRDQIARRIREYKATMVIMKKRGARRPQPKAAAKRGEPVAKAESFEPFAQNGDAKPVLERGMMPPPKSGTG